jgi:hypothetical protein
MMLDKSTADHHCERQFRHYPSTRTISVGLKKNNRAPNVILSHNFPLGSM